MSIKTFLQSVPQSVPQKIACTVLALVLSAVLVSGVQAGPREQAKQIHDRLAGVPPSADCLNQLETKVMAGNFKDAAMDAITHDGSDDECTGKEFYRVTLKNFITPWTNEEQTVFAPLNDYTATVIGIIRDDTDFREILYGDILYTGSTPETYAINSNDHYKALEDSGADLSDPNVLTVNTQTAVATLIGTTPVPPAAGVLTTRAAAKAFFVDGTNRAMFRFTLLNHLCTDMEQLKDPSYSPGRVQQDVSRSPGGDSRIFMNACVGCHNGMDPMTQAFAYYNYTYPMNDNEPDYNAGQMIYTPGEVQSKYAINANNFQHGYVTLDDSWVNYWRTGSNSALGWDSSTLLGRGNGASSMGQELAHSDAFARCQVEKVFKAVCLRSPVDDTDRRQVDIMLDAFQNGGYELKQVFADSAVLCMGN